MELFGIMFLPHTWPLVFGVGGFWLACVAIMLGHGIYHAINFLR